MRNKDLKRSYEKEFRRRIKNGTWVNSAGEHRSTPKAIITPSTKDLYWAAGFLEGEGYFRKEKKRGSHISATQVNIYPLKKLQIMFGGNVKEKWMCEKNKSQPYHWYASGARARGIMMTILPLLSPQRQLQLCRAALLAVMGEEEPEKKEADHTDFAREERNIKLFSEKRSQ